MNVSTKTFPYLNDGNLTLVPLSADTLELLRQWRNDNRKWFFSQDIVTPSQQQVWYERYVSDATCRFWVAHLEGVPVGTGALAHIDMEKREAEWSNLIVGSPRARGQGVARRICALVRDYGLDTLKLERIYGSLWTANMSTMRIDMEAGYLPYRVEGDVTHVELWRRNWRKK